MEELLTVDEAIKYLKVNPNTFRTWVRRKMLPDKLIMSIGATKRIRKSILMQWISGDITA